MTHLAFELVQKHSCMVLQLILSCVVFNLSAPLNLPADEPLEQLRDIQQVELRNIPQEVLTNIHQQKELKKSTPQQEEVRG